MPTERSTSAMHVGRLAGIPIGIQPLWLLIVAVITYALGHDYFPTEDPGLSALAAYALGLVSALALFAGIVLHELGHAVVARRVGVQVDEIDLWLLGGVARMHGDATRPRDELVYSLAGPAVTAVLLALFGALRLTLGDALPAWGLALLDYQVLVSAMILGFNLLPAFPLDGGRVARSLLWMRIGDADRATTIAAGIGRTFGWGFVGLGLLSLTSGAAGGLWLVLVGGFLVFAGRAELEQTRIARVFGSATVADVMTSPPVVVAASLPLSVVAERFAAHLFVAFPVVEDDGRAVGIVTIDHVRAVPAILRPTTRVATVTVRDPQLLVDPATPVAALLARPAFASVGRAVVVDESGATLGIVSSSDLQRRVRARDLEPIPEPLAA
jgi:Zn-dependent protease/predicted transcriptional regulator